MRATSGTSGSPHPLSSLFPARRAVFLRAPSPISCEMGSSSRELSLPCRVLPARARPVAAVRRSTFLGVRSRFAASTGGIHRCRLPRPRTVPSSTFLTSSTACSATGFAGLFRPAATSRVLLFRGFAPDAAAPPRRRPVPSWLASGALHSGCPACATRLRSTPGLALRRDPLRRARGLAVRAARSPPELHLLQVLLLRAVGASCRTLRPWPWPQDRQVVPAVDLRRFTDVEPGSPLSRAPTCSRFPASADHPLKGSPR